MHFPWGSLFAKMGRRDSTNFLRSPTLYYKMTNISLTLLRNCMCSSIRISHHKSKKVKACIFTFFSLCKPNKEKMEFSHFFLSFRSCILTYQREIFSFLFPFHSSFSFFSFSLSLVTTKHSVISHFNLQKCCKTHP